MSQPAMTPPSYEEAVNGVPPAEAPKGSLPVTNTPIHIPQAPATQVTYHSSSQSPTTQYNTQQNMTSHTSPHNHIPHSYSMCPPGAEPLLNLTEILVYPSKGRKYKIRDQNKETVMIAKRMEDDDCCGCTCESSKTFILCSLDGEIHAAQALCVVDSSNCCSYDQQHLEVSTSNALLGEVWVESDTKCTIVNQSGDLIFTLKRNKGWFQDDPYQVFTPRGSEVGRIDNSRGIKNRLTVAEEMPIHHKILLLFFAIFLQCEEDAQRKSSQAAATSSAAASS